jgi:hypothetical protein
LDFSQTEVQNLRVAAIGDEDVGRLDIAVNDAFCVGRIERISNFESRWREASLSR